MNMDAIFKVLANPVRVRILFWLKDPDAHFPPMIHLPEEEQGKGYVCVGAIQEKAEVTQSTVSHSLNLMKQVALLSGKRIGQWTYDRKNEETLQKTSTLPAKPVANGIVDSFIHTAQQYVTFPAEGRFQDCATEGILQTIREIGKKTHENPEEYDSRANLVWCSTMALKRWHDCFIRASGFNVIHKDKDLKLWKTDRHC